MVHASSTIEFHAPSLKALFFMSATMSSTHCVWARCGTILLPSGGHGKRRFPLKTAKIGPVFLRFLRLEDQVLPRADMRSHSHKRTKNTTHTTRVIEKTSSNKWRVCLRDAKQSPPLLAVMGFEWIMRPYAFQRIISMSSTFGDNRFWVYNVPLCFSAHNLHDLARS